MTSVAPSLLLVCFLSAPAVAAPPASGLYETWSPITRAPVGRLKTAPSPAVLPSWLKVASKGRRSSITFQPQGRVVWKVKWGAHGVLAKETLVDGQSWTQSRFFYDRKGKLLRKVVTGRGLVPDNATTPAGAAPPIPTLTHTYTHGRDGRDWSRTGPLLRMNRNGTLGKGSETWSASRSPDGFVATTTVQGKVLRADTFDPKGRLLETTFGRVASTAMTLTYKRLADGTLDRIQRRWGTATVRDVAPLKRDTNVHSFHVAVLKDARVQRHEVLLLLGAPVTSSVDGQGTARRTKDNYSDDCWLNAPSSFKYGPAGLLRSWHTSCICGFCVDDALVDETPRAEVQGVDRHWTKGPWIRLNGRVDVTSEHLVLTTDGPVPAGALKVGDELVGADWQVVILMRLKRLTPGPLRLGRNVRTHDGTFAAGGLRFASEPPCEMQ